MAVQDNPIFTAHTANGVTTVFPYGFEIASAAHLAVEVNGVITITGFTVSGAGNDSGGNVTFLVAPLAGTSLLFYRNMPYDRQTDYDPSGPFLERTIEDDQDYQTLQIQQLADGVGRSMRYSAGPITANTKWLGLGFELSDIAQATAGDSAATLDQVNALIATASFAPPLSVDFVFQTINALRANTVVASGAVSTLGYAAAGDGGQGMYRYHAADTVTADDGFLCIVDASGRRWKLLIGLGIIAKQAGIGYGTDDTTKLQAAINAASSLGVGTVFLPDSMILSGVITIPDGVSLIGKDDKTLVTTAAGTYTTFSIAGSDIVIRNLNIVDTAKTGGFDFSITCGTTTKRRIIIENILTSSSTGFITDSGSGSGFHISVWLTTIQCGLHRGPGMSFSRAYAFQFYTWVTFDYVGSIAPNFTGFFMDGAGLGVGSGGAVFSDCDVLGTASAAAPSTQIGYRVINAAEVWVRRSMADSCDGIGFQFNNINKLHLEDTAAGLCSNHAYELTSVTNSDFTKTKAFGRRVAGGVANIDGMRIVSGCANVTFAQFYSGDCTGHGIHKVAAQAGPINMNGAICQTNTGRGINSIGNSAFLAVGMSLVGNTAGNYNMAGTSDWLQATQLNSGAVVSVGPGPISG